MIGEVHSSFCPLSSQKPHSGTASVKANLPMVLEFLIFRPLEVNLDHLAEAPEVVLDVSLAVIFAYASYEHLSALRINECWVTGWLLIYISNIMLFSHLIV